MTARKAEPKPRPNKTLDKISSANVEVVAKTIQPKAEIKADTHKYSFGGILYINMPDKNCEMENIIKNVPEMIESSVVEI